MKNMFKKFRFKSVIKTFQNQLFSKSERGPPIKLQDLQL